MKKLNNLELKIVIAILENNKLEYPFLLKHLPFLVVESREYTGVGSYTNFSYSKVIETSVTQSGMLSSFQSLSIDPLQYELAYVLDVENGKITFLEIVTNCNEMWDGTCTDFKFE